MAELPEQHVSPETLKRLVSERAAAEGGPPGAEGTKRAIITEAEKWAEQYEAEERAHVLAAQTARANTRFWDAVARAAKENSA